MWMSLQGQCGSVDEAFNFYADRRTYDGKGITNASQMRSGTGPAPRLSCRQCMRLLARAARLDMPRSVSKSARILHRRYVRYFAAALTAWPPQQRLCLSAAHMTGRGILKGSAFALVVRCRPSGSAAAEKVAVAPIGREEAGLQPACGLEGDVRLEVHRVSSTCSLTAVVSRNCGARCDAVVRAHAALMNEALLGGCVCLHVPPAGVLGERLAHARAVLCLAAHGVSAAGAGGAQQGRA